MVIPALAFPNLVMIHDQLFFGLFKALLYGPAKTAEPHEGGQPGAHRGIAYEVAVQGLRSDGASAFSPEGASSMSNVFGLTLLNMRPVLSFSVMEETKLSQSKFT
jgi:hypothetical protein